MVIWPIDHHLYTTVLPQMPTMCKQNRGYLIVFFLVLFVVKPWLIFVREYCQNFKNLHLFLLMHFYILNELIILYTSNQKFVNSLFLLYFVPNNEQKRIL